MMTIAALILAFGVGDMAYGTSIEYFDHATFAAAAGNRNVVTFDNVPTETVLAGNEFAGLQITARRIVVIDPQDFAPGLIVGGTNLNSQPNGISASLLYPSAGSISFDNLDDTFTFDLLVSTQGAGLWIGNVGANDSDPITPTTVTFYDGGGAPIASETFFQGHAGQVGSGANNRFFYGITADVNIESISAVNAPGDGDGIIYDDVQWAVPEPASIILLAIVGLVLACRGWRRGTR